MKKPLLPIVLICAYAITGMAQAPEKFSYQAVIRDASNNLVVNQNVGLQISIHQGAAMGTIVYQETHTEMTNINGLVSLEVGGGATTMGTFASIDWGDGPYYIRTEIDPTGGTLYSIIGTTELISVPYALYAENVKKYKVGDFAHGGIVFYVEPCGTRGLVAAVEDQSEGVRWNAGTQGNTQAKGDGPYAGKANTSIIIAAQVAIGDDGDTYAARICNELEITQDGITYGDWYLPSSGELKLMYDNIGQGATGDLDNIGGFSDANYWSSMEGSAVSAWSVTFTNGSASNNNKILNLWVRAVRAF